MENYCWLQLSSLWFGSHKPQGSDRIPPLASVSTGRKFDHSKASVGLLKDSTAPSSCIRRGQRIRTRWPTTPPDDKTKGRAQISRLMLAPKKSNRLHRQVTTRKDKAAQPATARHSPNQPVITRRYKPYQLIKTLTKSHWLGRHRNGRGTEQHGRRAGALAQLKALTFSDAADVTQRFPRRHLLEAPLSSPTQRPSTNGHQRHSIGKPTTPFDPPPKRHHTEATHMINNYQTSPTINKNVKESQRVAHTATPSQSQKKITEHEL